LLVMLFNDMPVILSTDAGGVMRTSLEAEYLRVEAEILRPFRNGGRVRIEGHGEVTYDGISDPAVRRRFELQHLREQGEAYERSIAAHRDPSPPVPYGTHHEGDTERDRERDRDGAGHTMAR
jgi:hypothetical protein